MLSQDASLALKRHLIYHIGEVFGKEGVLWGEWNKTTWGCAAVGADVEFIATVVGDYNKGFLVDVEAKGTFWHDTSGNGHFRFSWVYAGTSCF